MNATLRLSVFAAALSCTFSTPVLAQNKPSAEQTLAEMRAQLAALASRIDQLEDELAEAKSANAAQDTAIAASARAVSPPSSDQAPATEKLAKKDGWSFKPRGRLMYDAGFTNVPETTGRDDGFGNEARRVRVGASGSLPGGFGYKFEIGFADGDAELYDGFLAYGDGPLEVTIGQHNNFQSLDELTSSLHSTFIERAAFTDAFGFERRIGASVTYSKGIAIAQAGIFTDNYADTGMNNRGVDGRLVLAPKIGDAQLHFGGSVHYNDLGEDEGNASVRYRQRPFVHFTSDRFVDTSSLNADSEFGLGLEAAAISGRLHAVAETYWQKVDSPLTGNNPTFFGGYAELGYYLTKGDTRGYKKGKFDRSKPANPVGEGGLGSLQLNLRYDYLDLNDAGIIGGIQNGYLASFIWKPSDYTLFSVNYGKMVYDDAVHPTKDGDTSYSVDAFGVRAQVDF